MNTTSTLGGGPSANRFGASVATAGKMMTLIRPRNTPNNIAVSAIPITPSSHMTPPAGAERAYTAGRPSKASAAPTTPSTPRATFNGFAAAAGLLVSGNRTPAPTDETVASNIPISTATPLKRYT